ncbi:hypothetical protein KDL44_12265 [bacterium]|nr:hypothetical protein [bacterium]
MSMELPESFYNEGRQRRLGLSRLRGWSILLIMFCIWNLFTPWGLIRRNRISAEFPNSEFGIQRAFITEERELVIERRGYVDRMSKYTYGPAGEFAELAEAELFTGVHVDSNPSISSTYRTEGVGFDIKPGSLTLEKIRRSSLRLRGQKPDGDVTDTGVPLNADGEVDIRSLKETRYPEPPIEDLTIRFLTIEARAIVHLLPGHQYLPFKDAHCYLDSLLDPKYRDGRLFITTDNQRYLHCIGIEAGQDEEQQAWRISTAALPAALERRFDSALLHDPDKPELILLNSDGAALRFSDSSLELLERSQLEGNWQREYASLFQPAGFYSPDFGIPLDRVQAFRFYRVLAALLLAGLIVLALGFLPGLTAAGRNDDADSESESPVDPSDKEISVRDLRL